MAPRDLAREPRGWIGELLVQLARRLPIALAVGAVVFVAVLWVGNVAGDRLRAIRGDVPATRMGPPAAMDGFTILAVNDIYRIAGLPESQSGGISRVRSVRARLDAASPDVLTVLAGDFLFPSLMSTRFQGEQMVAALNLLDGDAHRFDPRFLVTFGNHEFDVRGASGAELLRKRLDESQFVWLGSDLVFPDKVEVRDGQDSVTATVPGVASPQLRRSHLVNLGGAWVGVFSLTLVDGRVAYLDRDSVPNAGADRVERARSWARQLREEGADFVLALTHLALEDDLAILATLGPDGPDLIVGGHEHERILRRVRGRYVVKADADARTAARIRVRLPADGFPEVTVDYLPLDRRVAPDPDVQALAADWEARLDRLVCGGAQTGCLDRPVGRTRTPWDADERTIRGGETALGDWVADQVLLRFAGEGADAAMVNSGALRLNQDLPAGSVIRRRHVEELVGSFRNEVVLVDLDPETLRAVLLHSARSRGEGAWLQVAGITFALDPATLDVEAIQVGGRPLDEVGRVRIATLDYLVDPSASQDGYTMLGSGQVARETGVRLSTILLDALAADDVAPRVPDPPRITAPGGSNPPPGG